MIQRLLAIAWVTAVLAALTFVARADDDKQTFTDPEKAGPDFALQGEYVGTKEGQKAGVQIIARGAGKFDYALYGGGLPGDGWDGGDIVRGSAQAKDGVLVTEFDGASVTVADGKITATDSGTKVASFAKVERKSPTMGAKPPKGAVVLFDGQNTDAWKDGAKMTDDGLLMAGATTKDTFGAFTLHIEFRTPFKPFATGQGRGNSGFYAQGRYEVQMLDSFGLKGENNECGGIYSIKAPDLNMCFPPLSWQTFDIDFTPAAYDASGNKTTNARMTVTHNGVVVHKDVELPKTTTAAPVKESPDNGPIYLQNHGNPVVYRNIWLVKK